MIISAGFSGGTVSICDQFDARIAPYLKALRRKEEESCVVGTLPLPTGAAVRPDRIEKEGNCIN
jgi:hypothetical protein